jgi:hypothetical protein
VIGGASVFGESREVALGGLVPAHPRDRVLPPALHGLERARVRVVSVRDHLFQVRTNDVYRVLTSAAGSDPAAAELLGEIRQQRDQGQGQLARSLSRASALKPGLRQRDAADLIHALMSPEVYRLLVGDRGWTPERYEQWLATTLAQQLT